MSPRLLLWLLGVLSFAIVAPRAAAESSTRTSVWKVTAPSGAVLFLGGSVHKLRSTDYPLPGAFNRAFDLSQRLAFEVDAEGSRRMGQRMDKIGLYPEGDSLRNHVDPRTYAYVVKVFGAIGMPEAKVARCRPWFLHLLIGSTASGGNLGVERYFERRAAATGKKIDSLESAEEHLRVFSGLSPREAEAVLLLTFIPRQGKGGDVRDTLTKAWKRGEADALARFIHQAYADFPAMAERLLGARNRAWIPKIEGYLRSGQTYFVLAGAAHMGGRDGVVALLRARGYAVEQW